MVKIIANKAEWTALMETSKTKGVIVDFFAECEFCAFVAGVDRTYICQIDCGAALLASVTSQTCATGCGPCKMIAPAYAKMAEDNTDVEFAKVDVDNEDLEVRCETRGMYHGIAAALSKQFSTFCRISSGRKVFQLCPLLSCTRMASRYVAEAMRVPLGVLMASSHFSIHC
jgi:thiol-disulfide isomerase/thioredoxin